MPFTPNPTSVSKATASGRVDHTSIAESQRDWIVARVKVASTGDVLVAEHWEFSVTPDGSGHKADVRLKAGFEADSKLLDLFTNREQVVIKIRFGDNSAADLRVNLEP